MASFPKAVNQVEQLIHERLGIIRRNYRSTGDVETSLMAAEALLATLGGASANRSSIQRAKLILFVCDLRLSRANSIADLDVVRCDAERASEILLSSTGEGEQAKKALAMASLYASVALKAQSKKDDAFRVLARAKSDLRRYFDTNFVDEILLTRQETLMREEESGFANLLQDVPIYLEAEPVEAYASTKRVFEFALNNSKISLAKNLLPLLNATFRQSAPELRPLAKISYQKNVGQFLLLTGGRSRASRLLRQAEAIAASLGFNGQVKQIRALLSEFESGGHGRLGEFRVDIGK